MIAERNAFWENEMARPLEVLLKRAAYPDRLRREYLGFATNKLIPLLGPAPFEFTTSKPTTFLSDDHTPFELIWVIDSHGDMSVRFALEPISSVDGSSERPSISMRSMNTLSASPMKDYDLSWSNICCEKLVSDCRDVPDGVEAPKHFSQVMFGGEFRKDGILGKTYWFPNVRSAISKMSVENVVGDCMSDIGVGTLWNSVIMPYFQSMPHDVRPIPDMISVDCLDSSRNRVKVYFRVQQSSLDAMVDMVTLGGAISDKYVEQTVLRLRHLWGLLFPGVAAETPLCSIREKSYYPSGFLIYYEMIPGRNTLIPKIYISVRHYCRDDARIAAAISQYFRDYDLGEIGDQYTSDLERFFPHRALSARTGIHAYIALSTPENGPRTFMYMSPEVFAPERGLS